MRNVTLRAVRCGLALGVTFMFSSCATGPDRRLVGGNTAQMSGPAETAPVLQDDPPPEYPRGAGIRSEARRAYGDALDEWLAPPPPDHPQPKLVCERPEYDAEPVWYGQRAAFSWEVANTGAAPLRIHMRT